MEEALIKKIQPNNAEAEASVIGSMLMDRDALWKSQICCIKTIFIGHKMEFYLRRW